MTSTFFATPGLLAPMQGLLRWLTSGTLPARRTVPPAALPPLLSTSASTQASMQASPSASQECQRAVGIKTIANYSSRTWEKGINRDSRDVSRALRAPSAGAGAAASRSAAVQPAPTVLPALTRSPILSVLSVLPASPKIRTTGTVGMVGMVGMVRAMRAVRVRRLVEAGQAPASVGRMVISGRMADVCAELDRLAAREAALH